MKLQIKNGLYKDLRDCEAIAKDSLLYEHYFEQEGALQAYIRDYFPDNGHGKLLFAMADGKPAGFAVISLKGFMKEYHYLALLCVKKEYRSQGVGEFLLNTFVEMCRADGQRKAALMSSDFNVRARDFYKRNGFYECGLIPGCIIDGVAEYILLKDLV